MLETFRLIRQKKRIVLTCRITLYLQYILIGKQDAKQE